MSVRLIQGDCRALMPEMASESVDLIFADPPYAQTGLAWDKRVLGWLVEAERVLKPNGSLWVCGSISRFSRWPRSLPAGATCKTSCGKSRTAPDSTISAPPSGVVLDPFAGSGTTGVAAKELGRRAVLLELDQAYVKLSEHRLALTEAKVAA